MLAVAIRLSGQLDWLPARRFLLSESEVMTSAGDKILASAREALAFARGGECEHDWVYHIYKQQRRVVRTTKQCRKCGVRVTEFEDKDAR